ncbi:radical SAM family heme chaperone HemW [Pseudoclavibacter soli]|uniref:radical SAM family heme chaperone HemW n=1 Tax=Pseudoclavibacter soli TaxID=452623 RepID=UPI000424454D|nr:radical SAM family heme chaperone HemW [Pseudoclavibacter soli]
MTNRAFSVYVHVPFCRVRCGYCDFNTYTGQQLRGFSQSEYAEVACAEISLARATLAGTGDEPRRVDTVFFGGGTPTQLPVDDLITMLRRIDDEWGLAPGCEITTEANPDTVDAPALDRLAHAGFTRVSFGMQSAVPHVLATLDRTHTPQRVPQVVEWAKAAGLQTSLDLIYGTPGESMADWRSSVEAALACEPDHLSAYALIVEQGTKLARQIRHGEVAEPDDDLTADKYEWLDQRMRAADFDWYELSNWARVADDGLERRCRHNLHYWQGDDWWGVGPGAHSHVGDQRWHNLKHPAPYAEQVRAGRLPEAARETLDATSVYEERVMLASRLRTGLPVQDIAPERRGLLEQMIDDGLIDDASVRSGALVLTLRGRLLADRVVADLLV